MSHRDFYSSNHFLRESDKLDCNMDLFKIEINMLLFLQTDNLIIEKG